jgi:DNA-binding HxlR family transcriptional regulator
MADCTPRSYGSFCPVAQASEVVAQRWVPLILREIMVGYHRFNEIRHALPLISPSMLSRRLKSLEDDGVIRRENIGDGVTYHLTSAGEELRPIVEALGQWARKWVTRDYQPHELDPAVLMWSLRRHVVPARFPPGRTVMHFQLEGTPRLQRYWWIVVQPEKDDVDICLTDPGHAVALTAKAQLRTLVDVLMGDLELGAALRQGLIMLDGGRDLTRRFEQLFQFSQSPHSYAGMHLEPVQSPA